jgi:hypothetical protein
MFQSVPIFVITTVIKHTEKLKKMKLTKKALKKLTGQRTLSRLALALETSEMSIRRYIKSNHPNLTRASALQVIREETGLSDDQILEETESIRA